DQSYSAMTRSPHSTKTVADAYARSRAAWAQVQRACEPHELSRAVADWCAAGEAACLAERQSRAPSSPPPDGLRTKAEAAAKLGCSIKTLNGHVETGALSYVLIGHGRKRVRRMFADADLDQFIANQTRKDVPCPSIAPGARHTGTMTFGGAVIGFTAL